MATHNILSFTDAALDNSRENWKMYTLAAFVAYLVLVQMLRFQRINSLTKKYAKYQNRDAMSKMTDDEAFEITLNLREYEMPTIMEKSLSFALFKTYGIPTISTLLVKTDQFASKTNSVKRYADTVALIAEYLLNSPASPRAHEAIARMNFIHSKYQAAGKISNSDMLYTLSLFAVQPKLWVERFEWRDLTALELCAFGTFWKSLGDSMKISYEELPGARRDGGFKDGIEWIEQVEEWANRYEQDFMVPDIHNKKTADETLGILTWIVPVSAQGIAKNVVSAIMDDRLRAAMMYDAPPQHYLTGLSTVIAIRKFYLRHLSLPRFSPDTPIKPNTKEKGRYFFTRYDALPIYFKPTFSSRWLSGKSWWLWALGKPVPGDHGDEFCPRGFCTKDTGPKAFVGKGEKDMEATQEKLLTMRTGGCPFGTF